MPLILSGDTGISGVDGTAGTPSLQGTDSNTGVFYATDIVGIATNGTERMRIDSSGNVGIGTNSPNTTTANRIVLDINGTTSALYNISTGGTRRATFYSDSTDCVFGSITSIPLEFLTGGVERMRIDSSGNVGIGTTSPLAKLDVRSASVAITSGSGNISVFSTDSQGINLGGTLVLGGNADTQISFGSIAGRKENATTNNRDGYLQFSTYQNGVGNVERMRVSSIGTLMVNTTSEASSSAAVKIIANTSSTNTALQLNTGTSGGCAITNNVGNGFHIYGYTGAIGSESYNKVMENAGVGTSIALGGSSSVSGVGITFPATQVASSNANTLDDYEEGTWTPTLQGGSGSAGAQAYETQAGRYVKIGRFVMLTGYLVLTNKGSWTGSVLLGGFPFTVTNDLTSYSGSFFYAASITLPAASYGVGVYTNINATNAQIITNNASGTGVLNDYTNQVTNVTQIGPFLICYYASA